MEQKLLQQVKGLKPGRVGSGLTSLQHRPLGSWWLGAQLAETRELQSGVPVMQRIPLATTVSLEQAARQQEPSGAVRNMAFTSTLDLVGAQCERPRDCRDRKHTFSSRLSSRAEMLFAAPSDGQRESCHPALSSEAVLEAGKSKIKAPADWVSARNLSPELRARPLDFPAEHAAEGVPSTTAALRFHGRPLPSSLRETHVCTDGHPQPLELPPMASAAEEMAPGSHHLSCSGSTQGLGPEANPEVGPNLRATSENTP
ncbi:spectrin beta, non-erythrocytic 5 [Rhinolophus ferrumequinum]|uniref:Spectrin beta, non-erythrocytic 5 n=1 Tax=Rhinolophus ferrumequinum TaxID=59479 RepID=A0A7J7XS95_RHIFE|nr:spectrin beta, non-erythrocytic 5 [Rhinolophus ferrumequinum]